MRVEDDDRPHLLLGLDRRSAARSTGPRALNALRRERRRVAELVARVLVRRLDRRAGERVVELVEEEQLPGPRQLLARDSGCAPERVGDRAPLLGALRAGSRRAGSSA